MAKENTMILFLAYFIACFVLLKINYCYVFVKTICFENVIGLCFFLVFHNMISHEFHRMWFESERQGKCQRSK